MWVVKIGGSLNTDPLLPGWLDVLAHLGGGRVALVCGGGRFADEARSAQAHWQFNDLAAHNMAVLAMAQSAYMVQALQPALQLASSEAEILRVLHRGRSAVWLPMGLCRDQPDTNTNWDVAGDSIALGLASRLSAERLVVVKSCAIDHTLSLERQVAAGVLDARFAQLAEGASFPIQLLNRAEVGTLRDRLLGVTA